MIASQRQKEGDLHDETILVVDDEAAIRGLLRGILEEKGYRVLEASRNTEALHVAYHHHGPIHGLVVDVIMPGHSGPELVGKLKAFHPETKVLYISGSDQARFDKKLLNSKQVPFLAKPFLPQTFLRALQATLGTDARKFPRLPVQLPLGFSSAGLQGEGTVYDISAEGCAVTSEAGVAVGGYLQVQLCLPNEELPLLRVGIVRWSTPGKFGLEFLRTQTESQVRLDQLVETLQGGGALP